MAQHNGNGLYVLIVVDRSGVQARRVKVAPRPTTVIIAEGLKEDERLAASAESPFQPGSIVSIETGSGI